MAITSGDFFVTRTQPGPWGGAGETTVEDVDRDRLSVLLAAATLEEWTTYAWGGGW